MFTTTQTEPSSSTFELHSISKSRENKEVVNADMKNQSALGPSDPDDITNDVVPPENAVEARQTWNSSRINIWRVFSTFFSFFIVGMNDGSYGPLVPRLEEYYNLNYTVVSLVFLSPCAGYSLAAIVNNAMHVRFGQRGIAIVAPTCHLVSYIILAVHPPYPVLVVLFIFIGFGNGLLDAAWSAWIGNMANANQVSGFLQGFYSLGATIAPLITSLMVSQGGLKWYTFYYIMIGGAAVELVTNTLAFWNQTGKVYEAENPREPNSKTGRTREALKNKVTWVLALFVFGYMGAEVSLGGWIVTFMTKVRSSSSFAAGATTTGFWAGMTVGRVGLSFVTPRLGEFRSVLLYVSIAIVLELLFWLVPSLIVSAIAVAFLGLVLGPLFGTAIVLTAKILPKDLHVGTIGFATAIGGSGGAIFPFIVGAVAQSRGVRSLQPIILALLAVIAGLWLLLPIVGKMEGEGQEDPDDTRLTLCIPTWGQLNKQSRKFGRAN